MSDSETSNGESNNSSSEFATDSSDSEQSLIINETNEEVSNSDSDHDNFGVQPYQFEPLVAEEPEPAGEEPPMEVDNPRLHNTDWCNCGYCFVMPQVEESFCCRDVPQNQSLIEKIGPFNCVIQTDTFADIMRPNILNILYDEFRENNFIPAPDEVNPTYRYLIYRLYTRWIFRILGRRNRRPIPSCVINRVRREYPSDDYRGFLEPGAL